MRPTMSMAVNKQHYNELLIQWQKEENERCHEAMNEAAETIMELCSAFNVPLPLDTLERLK